METKHLITAALLALSGLAVNPLARADQLYVAGYGSDKVGVYNATTGVTINAGLITGLGMPTALALSGNNLSRLVVAPLAGLLIQP